MTNISKKKSLQKRQTFFNSKIKFNKKKTKKKFTQFIQAISNAVKNR